MAASLLAIALTALMTAIPAVAQDTTVYDSKADGVTLPIVLKQVKAQYTSEAMQQRIEGEVLLGVVVRLDGSVGDVTVKQSLDAVYGLDEQAVQAMKQWRFKPGTRDGKPVNVRVDVKIRFTLK
jgi:protein TonB